MEQEIYKKTFVGEESSIDASALARKIEAEVARFLIATRDVIVTHDHLTEIAECVIVKELHSEHTYPKALFEEAIMPYTWFYLAHPGVNSGGGFYLLIPLPILERLYEEKRRHMLGYVLRVVKRLLDLEIEDTLGFAVKSEEVVKKIASTMCWAFASRVCEYVDDPLSWYYDELMKIYRIEKQTAFPTL